jgi:NitT/TauT family transport system substrate-binding protein
MADKPTLRIGHIKITDHLVLGVTLDKLAKGEETFQNLTLENVPYMGWNQVGNALRGGDIDGAFILAPFAMDMFYAGLDIRLVLLGHRTGSVLVTNKRAHIQTIKDFKGRAIVLPLYLSVHTMLFYKLLEKEGLSIGPGKDVNFEVEAPSAMPEILQWDESGSVGGFIVAEPFATQAVLGGYGDEFALSKDIWPNHPCCVLVIKHDVLARQPDAVAELTQSLVKSGNFISENRAAAIPIAQKFLGQPEEVVTRVLTQPVDRVKTDQLYPKLEDLDLIQTYLTQPSINALSGKIDLEKFVDPQFAKAAGAK